MSYMEAPYVLVFVLGILLKTTMNAYELAQVGSGSSVFVRSCLVQKVQDTSIEVRQNPKWLIY